VLLSFNPSHHTHLSNNDLMGIIKTAMMSGAAMYGVHEISKGVERRHSSQQSYSQPQQQYRDYQPQGPAPRQLASQDYQYQYQEREVNDYDQTSPPPYYRRMISEQPAYNEDANFQNGGYRQQPPQQQYMYEEQNDQFPGPSYQRAPPYQRAGPPRYAGPGQGPPEHYGVQQQRGFVEPYPVDDPQQGSSSCRRGRNGLVSQAVQFASSQGGSLVGGRNRGKGESAQEFLVV